MMERGSNLNIPDFWETHFYVTLCNNNPTFIEFWVQLGTIVKYQGTRNLT